jgi:hypothetical protein
VGRILLSVAFALTSPSPADVEKAVRASPYTYFAFADARWWGRPVRITIDRVRISERNPGFAGSVVTPRFLDGRRAAKSEVVLVRRRENWRVVRAQSFGPFACSLAPRGVMRELFNRCVPERVPASASSFISGPLARRRPTAAERTAILAAVPARIGSARRCFRYPIYVSRLDRRYAFVDYVFTRPDDATCPYFNGTALLQRRRDGRWREKSAASTAFPCRVAPPGVIRSLFRVCEFEGAANP